MTPAERRAWVSTCSGSDGVAVVESDDRIEYSAQGPQLRTQVSCSLSWDRHRERLASLTISIVAPDEEGVREAAVTHHAELVMSEMDERDRDAAIAVRAAAAGDVVELATRRFVVAGGKDLWPEGWSWRIHVGAATGGDADGERAPSEDATRWFALHTFRELPASKEMSVEIFSGDGVLAAIVDTQPFGIPPHVAYTLVNGWHAALEAGHSTRSVQAGDHLLVVSAGYTNAFRRADGAYQAQLQGRASLLAPDADGQLRWRHRIARGGPIVFTTSAAVTLGPRAWFRPARRGETL